MRLIFAAAATAFALSGCVQQTGPNTYDPYSVGQVAYTETGVIQSARSIQITSDNGGGTGIGAAVGAIAGGIAGSQIGPSSHAHRGHRHRYTSAGSALGTLGGALIGGLIGAAVERDVTRQNATEYVVRLDSGDMITIVQGDRPLSPGQRVFLHSSNAGRARLVPAA